MAKKADLESREADCKSVDDIITLAQQALAKPADKAYAKELLQKAELQCQMPLDYIKAADVAAGELGDAKYASELYEQAEDMLFEVPEFTAFAHAMAIHIGDKDKAREYLQKAADEASKLPEFLAIANLAQQDLADEEFAKSLLSKVEEKAKGFDDYRDLAKTVLESGDPDTARTFFKEAARFCDDIPATVNYAQEIFNLFNDKDWARQTLDEAETDCQFTKQFVQLAQGYKDIFEDMDKVNELIEQAAEFCMTGEEQVDLADGYWNLLGDKDKAADSYQLALADITDKQALLELAKKVVTELENVDLAKTIYAKAESRMSSSTELSALAQVVMADLRDKDYAAQVYERAAQSLVNPNDLVNLAGDIVTQLDDKERAALVYRKAFERAGEIKQLLNLVDQVDSKLGDKDFVLEILEKAEQSTQESPILVDIAGKVISVLNDKPMATRVLENAEECVTSLGEIKTVTQTIKTYFGDNAEWVSRVDEKLARREANQAKYNAFQQRENQAESPLDHLRLTDAVMAELEDKFYARKLLVSAEQAYQQQGYDFNQGRDLVIAINNYLGDQDWIKRILDDAAQRCMNFSDLHAVGQTALSHYSNTQAGQALARDYFQAWEKKLDDVQDKSVYDYTKLAGIIGRELGDRDWASALIDKAAQLGGDHFAFAQMGAIEASNGDVSKANDLYRQAAGACQNPTQLQQLVRRMKSAGVDDDLVRELYTEAKSKLQTPLQRLLWAEGIVQLFKDQDWASREYDELANEPGTEDEVLRIHASRQSHLQTGLW